jgi:hypothetical protein
MISRQGPSVNAALCMTSVSLQDDARFDRTERVLYITLYLWQGIQNLIAASVVWARCAEVFGASTRVFGVLAASATTGQLAGTMVVQALSTLQSGPMTASATVPFCVNCDQSACTETPLDSLPRLRLLRAISSLLMYGVGMRRVPCFVHVQACRLFIC